MSELLPHLARPAWLLLLPLCGWLLWRLWHRERRLGRWQALLPAAFQPWLLQGGRHRQSRLAWLLLGLAWLLALLALIGPGWQRLEQPAQLRSDPLVAIVELTPQMLAADLAPNRLEHARRKLLDLLAARGAAQTAIVVYAGSAHVLVPLSDDLATAQNLLSALTPTLMPEPGQRADLAVQRALALLDQGANGHGRLLLLSGALDAAEQSGIRAALEERDNPLLLLGVGTPAGAPVPLEDGGFLRDAAGSIVLPRLHGEQLAAFAASLGGGYSPLRLDDGDLADLGLLGSRGARREAADTLQPLAAWADQGHWLLLPLLLLAACAGRRGWLFALTALLISPPPAMALDFADLWWRSDQQGQRLLEAGRPAEAAQRFSDPQWRGLALYRAGDYAAAAEAFAQGADAAAHYNRGNALALGGELAGALDAYEQALREDPQLEAARHNRELVAQLLHSREQAAAQAAADSARQQPGDATESAGERGSPSQSRSPSPDQHSPEQTPSERAREELAAAQDTSAASVPASDATPAGGEQQAPPADPASPPPSERDAAQRAQRGEQRQALEQWLRQIPDDPAELLRRKFWYEQQQRQENPR
ncbi:Ca-activated chloride channel family protein [Geopseudomonas sagittaria]|uniref:Ca-activated chloride channel family protein n=1 Tax=Geopseudomonas sagittaria TaxID=1135990 RepID=A0A1I5VR70_9GAMM|nr:VWA domain-containing protein [Pseudomonas sagittaria]SFQ09940.1 Ca-activated chloride channel family protein [Pseudomonas sagittaria]